MTTAGTLELLASEFATIFQPLEQRFSAGNVPTMLAELGLRPPVALTQAPALATSLAQALSAVTALPTDIASLVTAISSGDQSGTISAGTALVEAIASAVRAITALAGTLNSLSSTIGLTAAREAELLAFAEAFVERVLERVFIEYLERRRKPFYVLFLAIGAIEISDVAGGPADSLQGPYQSKTLSFDRLLQLFTSPIGLLEDIYKWGATDFDGIALFTMLALLLDELVGVTPEVLQPTGLPATLEAVAFSATVDPSGPLPGLVVSVRPAVQGSVTQTLPDGDWTLALGLNGSLSGDADFALKPPFDVHLQSAAGSIDAGISVDAQRVATADPIVIFGQTGGSRLEVTTLSAGTSLTAHWDIGGASTSIMPSLSASVTGGRLVIDTSSADSFIGALLSGEQVDTTFNIGLSWSHESGLQFSGAAAMEIAIPVDLTLGPITIPTIYLDIGFTNSAIPIQLSAAIAGTIGPVSVSVDQIGVAAELSFPSAGGNLGPAQFDIGFKPPGGLGLSIAAGPISGGGYISFDPTNGRYTGALALSLYSVQVTAIGILDTKLPNGASGYSFLIVISVQFTPIQLGFGFTLNGVGGLCGINRDFVADAIQAGLRAHSLDAILFPPNPIANAPTIISDLQTIFPPTEGRYAFGPMAKLAWGGGLDLITAELGILMALPSPVVISILGQVDVNLPNPVAPIVVLHLDVLGTIDFGQKLFSLDATLHDSRIVAFTICGDMAMRLDWGDNPSFALAIGGLNPHFQPPDGFPQLERLTIALSATSSLELTIQAYLAITSNTFQFGAQCELLAGVSAFNIYGWLGFDALLVFTPFSFDVDFTAGLALRSGTSTLMGISVDGELSGPTPWHVTGDAHVSILFFSISVHVDVTWGDNQQVSAPPVDAWPPLLAALANVQNWSGSLPAGIPTPVTLSTPAADPASIYVDPNGVLTLRERVLPLNQTLTKFGAAVPGPQTTFTLSTVQVGGAALPFSLVDDLFAPGQFEALADQDALSRPSFDEGVAGFSVGAGQLAFGQPFGLDLQYVDIYDDDLHTPPPAPVYFTPTLTQQLTWARSNNAFRAGLELAPLAKFAPAPATPPLVTFGPEQFVIATTTDLTQRSDLTAPVSEGEAYRALAAHLAANPSDRGQLQVLPLYELAA